jgi:hypothetical protein
VRREWLMRQLLFAGLVAAVGLAAGGGGAVHGWAGTFVNVGVGYCLVTGILLLVRPRPGGGAA